MLRKALTNFRSLDAQITAFRRLPCYTVITVEGIWSKVLFQNWDFSRCISWHVTFVQVVITSGIPEAGDPVFKFRELLEIGDRVCRVSYS